MSQFQKSLVPALAVGGDPHPPAMSIAEFADRCNGAPNPDAVFQIFQQAAQDLGFDRLAYVPVTPAARSALGQSDAAPVLSANVPQSWVEHYFKANYEQVDPVLMLAPQQDQPLIWEDIGKRMVLTPKQRRVLAESKDAGLFNGVSIPLHGPRGESFLVSLATETRTSPLPADRPADLAHLHMLAIQFMLLHSRALRQCAGEPLIRITDRERECLTWTARGKSAWSIGKILGVSEHTVNFHLKQCMGKLGATNRMQAVVAAVRLGMIVP